MTMNLTTTPIDFVEVLENLASLIGKEVAVHVSYGGYAGGASFFDRLLRVETMDLPGDPPLLHFERESLVSLTPSRMQAFRVTNDLTERSWLEFAVQGRRVFDIEEVA